MMSGKLTGVKVIDHGLREGVFFELDSRDPNELVMRLVSTQGLSPVENISTLKRVVSTYSLDYNEYRGPSDEGFILELNYMFGYANAEGLDVELTDELTEMLLKYKNEMYRMSENPKADFCGWYIDHGYHEGQNHKGEPTFCEGWYADGW